MKTTRKIILLLIVVPVLTLGAGVVAGMLASRLPAAHSTMAAPHDVLMEQLDLTSDQFNQMHQIWQNSQTKMQHTFEQAEKLQSQREDALIALLPPDKKAEFQAISRDFATRRAELDQARDKIFKEAVQQSEDLMNDSQKKKYEQILSTHVGPLSEGIKAGG